MRNIFRNTLLACAIGVASTYPVYAQAPARAPLTLAEDAPQTYTVVKGDTLWDISGKFLNEPWLWPEIWDMNKEQIKNPHLIYPGDVIVLKMVNGSPRLTIAGRGDGAGSASGYGQNDGTQHYRGARLMPDGTLKLSPIAHETNIEEFVPSIPPAAITPFLSRPLVDDNDNTHDLPYVITGMDERNLMGQGDTIYVKGLRGGGTTLQNWQIYRPSEPLKDPETGKIIAYESIFLGSARTVKYSPPEDIMKMTITQATAEIQRGDRLQLAEERGILSYVPHRPESEIQARVVKTYGAYMGGQKNVLMGEKHKVIVINRGANDGLEMGHVLALHRVHVADRVQTDTYGHRGHVKLPDERYGLVFVFRTFDNVSYALVMEAEREINVGDKLLVP